MTCFAHRFAANKALVPRELARGPDPHFCNVHSLWPDLRPYSSVAGVRGGTLGTILAFFVQKNARADRGRVDRLLAYDVLPGQGGS